MKNCFIYLLSFCFWGLAARATAGEKDPAVVAGPNEVILETAGAVCSFCVQGAKRNLAKLPFIDERQPSKGVMIDIYTNRLILNRDPAKPVDFNGIREAITKGGYEVLNAHLRLDGTLLQQGGKWLLKETGAGRRYALQKGLPAGLAAGDAVVVQARIHGKTMAAIKRGQVVPVEVKRIAKAKP